MAQVNGDAHTNPHEPTIPFHPGPGTVHEIAVMLGFVVAFVLSMTSYLLMWRSQSPLPICLSSALRSSARLILGVVASRRAEKTEIARRAAVTQQRRSAIAEESSQPVINSETLRRWSWGGVQAF